jgi:hypothetical protein
VYPSASYNGGVHIALMGDPTLSLINENAIDSIVKYSDYQVKHGLSVYLKEGAEIYGLQLFSKSKAIYINYYNQTVDFDFLIDLKNIESSYENTPYMLRPIIMVENKSGRFLYTGNGVIIR